MAHNLNFNELTNQHSFFSVKQKAWHGLGQIIDQYPNSAEALKLAGLNFTVEKRPLFTQDDFFNDVRLNNHFATVRADNDNILGVVGKDYEIVQNLEAFEFFDSITNSNDGVFYETAGALGLGEKVFITAKLPDYIKVGKDDLIEKYLFLTTSHDGSGSITAAFTPVRIVCNNTLNAAMRNCSNVVKIRHTKSANENLKNAHKIMGISDQLANELEEVFNYWTKLKIEDAEVKKLIALALAPNKEVLNSIEKGEETEVSGRFNNIVNSAFEYAMTADSQQMETTKGTVFGAYNAITGYLQNVKSYTTEDSKINSLLFGGGLNQSQKAFNLCLEYS